VPVGLVLHANWSEATANLARGDLLCVYTDGFTEATNADDEEFGLARMEKALTSRLSQPAREISDALYGEVAAFAGGVPQYDDQTLLIVRRER
jgi:sigma-B regulation protein RsbU (phosphoserine phosphatase)